MDTKISHLIGNYKKKGAKLIKEDSQMEVKFILCERKEPTKKKAKEFLLYSINQSKPKYFSSLYPLNEEGRYTAEYEGNFFTITLKKLSAFIAKREEL